MPATNPNEKRTLTIRYRIRPSEFLVMAKHAGGEERVNDWARDQALIAAGILRLPKTHEPRPQ